MAGTIIVSSIKTDTDNSFIVRSNTGATLFSVDTTTISIPDGSITSAMIANGTVIAADILDGTITTAKIADGNVTNAKIDSVANTKITGNIISSQITSVANTQITGNITQAQIATGVAGTGPAFIAYANTTTSLTSGVYTKITFNIEEYDTNSNFASSRFTPTVAGYYQISGGVGVGASATSVYAIVYKNGSAYNGQYTSATTLQASVSTLVYLNGSTDYVELYANFGSTQNNYVGDRTQTYFQGFLARSA